MGKQASSWKWQKIIKLSYKHGKHTKQGTTLKVNSKILQDINNKSEVTVKFHHSTRHPMHNLKGKKNHIMFSNNHQYFIISWLLCQKHKHTDNIFFTKSELNVLDIIPFFANFVIFVSHDLPDWKLTIIVALLSFVFNHCFPTVKC